MCIRDRSIGVIAAGKSRSKELIIKKVRRTVISDLLKVGRIKTNLLICYRHVEVWLISQGRKSVEKKAKRKCRLGNQKEIDRERERERAVSYTHLRCV